MRTTTTCFSVIVLILCSLSLGYASDQNENLTPILSILLAGSRLPAGKIIYPETGAVLIRYDRSDSKDWIEITGTNGSGKPSGPVTQLQGNIENNFFTIFIVNNQLIRFIYPVWTVDVTYEAAGNPDWTFTATLGLKSNTTILNEQASTVDCSKDRLFYETSLAQAQVLWSSFYFHWTQWQVNINGMTPGVSPSGSQLLQMADSLGIVYDLWSGDPAQMMPFINQQIEATRMLTNYDIECTGTCADRGLTGPEVASWKGREWQRCNNAKWYNWTESNSYCENLILGGHADWRLPTKDELKSLVVCTNNTPVPLKDSLAGGGGPSPNTCGDGNTAPYDQPTIAPQFPYTEQRGYATSTTFIMQNGVEAAWYVHFMHGQSFYSEKESSWNDRYGYSVRCIR